MRHLLTCAFTALLGLTALQAQNPKGLRTEATINLENYLADPRIKAELKQAYTKILTVAEHEKMQTDVSSFLLKAKIGAYVALDEQLTKEFPKAALEGYQAAIKALELEEAAAQAKNKPLSKIGSQNDFRTAFNLLSGGLFNGGIEARKVEAWKLGYQCFKAITEIGPRTAEFTTKKAIEMRFKEPMTLIHALVLDFGINAALKKGEESVPLKEVLDFFDKTVAANGLDPKDQPLYFAKVVNVCNNIGEKDKARKYLKEGRERYPKEQNLLISEINMALAEGRLAEVEGQLQTAIEGDPSNVEFVFTLGNVYDEIMRKEAANEEKADEAKCREFFGKAVASYEKALKIKPDHFNSVYSLGAIHINLSAAFRKIIDPLQPSDKRYKQLDAEADKLVNQGLTHLLQAEKLNPNDILVVNALKEIYAGKNDMDNMNKYKKRLEELKSKQ